MAEIDHKRRFPRYGVAIPATIRFSKQGGVPAEVLSISLRGAMIECDEFRPPGEVVWVEIRFENGKRRDGVPVKVQTNDGLLQHCAEPSVVRWSEPGEKNRLGIEFLNPKLDTLEFLARLTKEMESTNPPDSTN